MGFKAICREFSKRFSPEPFRPKTGAYFFDRPPKALKPLGERILVLAPHPDDDVIGCGGTLCSYIEEKSRVRVVYFTDGRNGDPESKDCAETVRIRKQEAVRAAAILGIEDLIFLEIPENTFSASSQNVEVLVRLLKEYEPDLVYLPWFLDAHPDHLTVNRLFLKASRKLPRLSFHCCGYEVWTPLWPNVVVDITDHVEQKQRALSEYKSQLKHVDYVRASLGINLYRTMRSFRGQGYAEAFLYLKAKTYADCVKKYAWHGIPPKGLGRDSFPELCSYLSKDAVRS